MGIKKIPHSLVQKKEKRVQGWGPENPGLKAKQRKTSLEGKKQCPEKQSNMQRELSRKATEEAALVLNPIICVSFFLVQAQHLAPGELRQPGKG